MPYQVPMRGGMCARLRIEKTIWRQTLYQNNFAENRLKLVDMIAYTDWQNLNILRVRFF
jgi:hypothetical protein